MDGLFKRLGVHPGMTILDIGTGTGMFAYRFAEQVGGAGRVYATDVSREMIDYVSREARRRGLGKVFPVLVQQEGLDDFYRSKKFDVVFICHVKPIHKQRIEFMSALRDSLSDQGRVVVVDSIDLDTRYYLDPAHVSTDIVPALARLGDDDPFSQLLSAETRGLLRDPGADASEAAASAVQDMNAALQDPAFFRRFIKGGRWPADLPLAPMNRKLARWLLSRLKGVSALDKPAAGSGSWHAAHILNTLILKERFREQLILPAYKIDEAGLENDMAAAGYQREGGFYDDFGPMDFMGVFSKAP